YKRLQHLGDPRAVFVHIKGSNRRGDFLPGSLWLQGRFHSLFQERIRQCLATRLPGLRPRQDRTRIVRLQGCTRPTRINVLSGRDAGLDRCWEPERGGSYNKPGEDDPQAAPPEKVPPTSLLTLMVLLAAILQSVHCGGPRQWARLGFYS